MTPEKLKEIEAKAYPFYGYAPGNYLNTCSCCKKDMYNVDKLCFVCIECAIKFSQSENTRLRERVRELAKGLDNLLNKIESNLMTKDIAWYKKEKREARQLLTKPDSTGGGEKEVLSTKY